MQPTDPRHGWLAGTFRVDPLAPDANGHPHFVSDAGGHLYVGCKDGRKAWVLDEEFSPTEASGCAVTDVKDQYEEYPGGERTWKYYKEGASAPADHVLRIMRARP